MSANFLSVSDVSQLELLLDTFNAHRPPDFPFSLIAKVYDCNGEQLGTIAWHGDNYVFFTDPRYVPDA